MNADLLGDEGPDLPCPAWRVIEAARRQFLTGELVLDTNPPTNVYLRDGQVYFAERSTDGGLGVRLLVEGVITRAQLQKGTLLVSGAEHLGRLFERDQSIERESVELCVELMTDDVLVGVAEEPVGHYSMTMYKRHPSGIDRWMPTKVEVITRLVERPEHADEGATVAPAKRTPARTRPAVTGPVAVVAAHAVAEPEPVTAEPVVAEPVPDIEPVAEPMAAAEPVVEPVVEQVEAAHASDETPAGDSRAGDPSSEFSLAALMMTDPTAPAPAAPHPMVAEPVDEHVDQPAAEVAAADEYEQPASMLPAPVLPPPAPSRSTDLNLLERDEPLTPEALMAERAGAGDDSITLAESAVELILSSDIAEEVAEAVRRALAAIDAAQPVSVPDDQA